MRPKSTTFPRVCATCGSSFLATSRHKTQRFCSSACYHSNRPLDPPEERFWKHVKKTATCWLWTGSITPNGYAQFVDMNANRKKRLVVASRFSWELHYGQIPEGMLVCHNCPGGDNRHCVNPAHLFLGTYVDNMQDALAKGRYHTGARETARFECPRGEQHYASRLSEAKVIDIRRRAAGGEAQKSLAIEYGVRPDHVSRIVHRLVWKHVP